ncbi:MAG: 5-(carboxyamino)imidazole ribonucleotide mutase [Clostridia bacterium]|nr:5-(carboxyamino)imidazole ribonucleotide mutase [Clostridia bacterium]MBR5721768.1 5-(carboxyamino)imidazole ribonucleotide mutase [Clostridia bacterium]
MKKAAIIMGSDSDLPVIKPAFQILEKFGVEYTVNVISAHRTPDRAAEFSKSAKENGYSCIICAAGKAAHLAGVMAAYTALPVIGIPIKSSTLDGLDSLLSTVQMPKGVPVATVAIDGAENAALLALQIMAVSDGELYGKLVEYKKKMAEDIYEKDTHIAEAKQF